jgi:PAS domain S-box-containing protein
VSGAKPAEWLSTTAGAVRELIAEQLAAGALDNEARRAMEMALKDLDIIWEQLEGQTAQLVIEKERYAEFFEFAPEACLITDVGGSVREANLAALELLGATREDLIGGTLREHLADDDRIGFLARTATLTGPLPICWQAVLRHRTGALRGCMLSVRPIALKRSGAGGLCWQLRPLDGSSS